MTQKKINGYVVFMKQVLGKGSYGVVYRGQQDGTKKQCAIKILQKNVIDHDEYLKAALFTQIQILQSLKSDNIVKVLDVMESSHNYYIIQQMCDNDLQRFMEHSPKIPQQEAIRILQQICNGFITLVKEGIVHRDLKPANIFLAKGVVKIGDFGFAKKNVTKRMKNATSVGTPLYMPLQILKSEPYTSKCDIWAVGFIFYEMLHGKTPWTAATQFQLVKNIENKPLVINQNLKAQTKDFLTKCLKIYQADRLSWDEIFVHPLFNGFFNQYAKQNQQFQDKLKMVMTQLRFQINSKNIDLNRLLQSLGFKKDQQLSLSQFSQFVKHIHPNITKDQIKFFFQKIDFNEDGGISVSQLSTEMEKHHINFNKNVSQKNNAIQTGNFNQNLKSTQNSSIQQNNEKKLSRQLELKAKKCFIKLFKILNTKKLTLFKTFNAYDTDRNGELTLSEFQKIMKRLDTTYTDDQIQAVFYFIDIDKSKTIQFDQMNSYYCKINGIPQTLELPPQYIKARELKNRKL